jgi:NAD(P)-dependent dehydrogenase (short-subunit alcohol dehydrogenase family)
VVAQVLQKHGRIDAIANCVGNVVAQSTLATEVSDLEAVLRVNLYSAFNVVKAGVKAMLREEAQQQRSGALVLVSAALASHGIANYEAMSAAKAAVEGEAQGAQGVEVQQISSGVLLRMLAHGLELFRYSDQHIGVYVCVRHALRQDGCTLQCETPRPAHPLIVEQERDT